MIPRDIISVLDTRLARSLARFPQDVKGMIMTLPQPERLAERVVQLATIFDEGKPLEPPSQARINALDRLRQGKVQLTSKDWNLIAWGLCDDCGHSGRPIETNSLFAKVMVQVESNVKTGISRKTWFGLLHSYFAYPESEPASNPNWLSLRAVLDTSLPELIRSQVRPKRWTQVLETHRELLTDDAGNGLANALFAGNDAVSSEVAMHLPIPETSWLWQRIITAQLKLVDESDEDVFLGNIGSLIGLARHHPYQADQILVRVLTRYERTDCRDNAHDELKQFALDQWQNPQMKSASRWSLVSESVHKMMLHWFAKADLEHFFSLLQGSGSVDHDRLEYWLRFVDQISYTRIVMGGEAYANDTVDFIDFRKKNLGRFSRLTDNNWSNNAFMMQIGEYFFVEFSGTGNACYVYSKDRLPFNPEKKNFLLVDLKNRAVSDDRIIHNGDWMFKADQQLRKLGIFPVKTVQRSHKVVIRQIIPVPLVAKSIIAPPVNERIQPQVSGRASNGEKEDSAVYQAEILIKGFKLSSEDHRLKGGAFWVLEKGLSANNRQRLLALGFGYVPTRGYWVK